jgi:hypothetical protein
MKDRIRSVCQEHTDSNGTFRWPSDEAERNKLASRLFGACVVAGMDSWMEKALAKLPPDLSPEQQSNVKRLLFQTVSGVVFSILVKLDQFPTANLDMVLSDPENDERLASVIDGEIFDLHDRIGGWLEQFSDYAKDFA